MNKTRDQREQCPLRNLPESEMSEGFVWDQRVPNECWPCLAAALDSDSAVTEDFEPEIFEDEIFEGLDKFVARGIRADDATARTVVEEFGIESDCVDAGPLISRTTIQLTCRKA